MEAAPGPKSALRGLGTPEMAYRFGSPVSRSLRCLRPECSLTQREAASSYVRLRSLLRSADGRTVSTRARGGGHVCRTAFAAESVMMPPPGIASRALTATFGQHQREALGVVPAGFYPGSLRSPLSASGCARSGPARPRTGPRGTNTARPLAVRTTPRIRSQSARRGSHPPCSRQRGCAWRPEFPLGSWVVSMTGARSLSPSLQPVTETPSALSLSGRCGVSPQKKCAGDCGAGEISVKELQQDLSACSQRLSAAAVTQSAGVGADLLKFRERWMWPPGYSSHRQSGAQFVPNLTSA
jgi:hypothetical protein